MTFEAQLLEQNINKKEASGTPCGTLLESLEAILGAFWGSLGASWGHLGGILRPGPREEALRGPQHTPQEAPRGPQMAANGRQQGPMRVPKDQKVKPEDVKDHIGNENNEKLKNDDPLNEIFDFEASKEPNIFQNRHPAGFKSSIFKM